MARHAFAPGPERDRDRFELEDSLAAYILVAWSEADLLVLLRAGRRVAGGLVLGRWHGVPDFVPGEDDLLHGLPEAFAQGVCRALGVLVAVVGCGLAVDGPTVGLGPVDLPRSLVAAVLAGWAVIAATSRRPRGTQLVVLTIGGGLLLRGDAVVVAAVVAGVVYAVARARYRITTFLLAGRPRLQDRPDPAPPRHRAPAARPVASRRARGSRGASRHRHRRPPPARGGGRRRGQRGGRRGRSIADRGPGAPTWAGAARVGCGRRRRAPGCGGVPRSPPAAHPGARPQRHRPRPPGVGAGRPRHAPRPRPPPEAMAGGPPSVAGLDRHLHAGRPGRRCAGPDRAGPRQLGRPPTR